MNGTFSSVEKETNEDGSIIAIKTYRKSNGKLVYIHYKREMDAFKKLNITHAKQALSNHIIYLIGTRETTLYFQLLFPFYQETLGTALGRLCENSRREFAYNFMQQISKGLSFIHEKDIVHCDLSPSNILIDAAGFMCISDFGCSQSGEVSVSQNEEIGTRWYKAPEHLFNYKVYAPTTDIWSLGTIFAEILIGKTLFAGEGDLEQIGIVVRALGNPSSKVQEEISIYPDFNKLTFFTASDVSDYEESDGEYERPIFKTLVEILKDANIPDNDQALITSILTWSRNDRATLNEISIGCF